MAEIRECLNCRTKNDSERYFCSECGAFLRRNELSDSNSCSEEEFKIKRIVSNIPQIPHKQIFWHKNADAYCKKIERLQALLEVSDEKPDSYQTIIEHMKEFLEKCRAPEYQIAFVGMIKTGKSTLINALLGKDYASMDITPETAVLTKFRKSHKDYVKVVFYSAREWDKLWNTIKDEDGKYIKEYKELEADQHKEKWINHEPIHKVLSNDEIKPELSKWSTSKTPEHFFVKEIEVGISTLPNKIPPEVVFVDTPGLSDPVSYRSEITKKYIKNANAVLVCISAEKIEKDHIDTIASIFSFCAHKKEKVHIIATKWDMLPGPMIAEWKKQKAYFIENLVGPSFFDNDEAAENNLMHASSYLYTLCKNYKGSKKEEFSLHGYLTKIEPYYNYSDEEWDKFSKITPEIIEEMIELSNIDYIRSVINDRLVSKYSENMLQDMAEKYKNILAMCKRYAENSKQDISKTLSAANGTLDELREKLEQTKRDYDEIWRKKEMLEGTLEKANKETEKRLKGILEQLEKING